MFFVHKLLMKSLLGTIKKMKVSLFIVCYGCLLSLVMSIEEVKEPLKENYLVYYDTIQREIVQMSLDFTKKIVIFKPPESQKAVDAIKVKQTKEHIILYWLEYQGTVIKKTRIPITSGTAVTEDAFKDTPTIKFFEVHPTFEHFYLAYKNGLRIKRDSEETETISNDDVLWMKFNPINNHLYVTFVKENVVIFEEYDFYGNTKPKGFSFTSLRTLKEVWDTDGTFLYFSNNEKLYKVKLLTEGEMPKIPVEQIQEIASGRTNKIERIILRNDFLYLISVTKEGNRQISKVNIATGQESKAEAPHNVHSMAILESAPKGGSSSTGPFKASVACLLFMAFSALINL